MELCDHDLQYFLDKNRPTSDTTGIGFQKTCQIILHTVNGLEYIHKHGEVHRDVKPRNSMYQDVDCQLISVLYSKKEDLWKLADFGLTSEGSSTGLETTTYCQGTQGYRAPELVAEEEGRHQYNNKVDIWSLGCILYECISGRKAFPNDLTVLTYLQARKDFAPGNAVYSWARNLSHLVTDMLAINW
jgi:serine/threonine protein kinase